MAEKDPSPAPVATTEEDRIAAKQFEYANRAFNSGSYTLAIQLLWTCCKLAPMTIRYRQMLRKAEKAKYSNKRGRFLAYFTTFFARMGLNSARRKGKHLKVLEHGETILTQNPWDIEIQLVMAEAAQGLSQPVLALWILEQAREKDNKNARVNRALARLCEQLGRLPEATHFWDLVRRAVPTDLEAQDKVRSLPASETIARGNYEEVISGEPTLRQSSNSSTPVPPTLGATPAPGTKGARLSPVQERRQQEETGLRARVDSDPSNAENHLNLAAYYTRHGQPRDAKAVLQRGMEAIPGSAELTQALAELEIEAYRRALAKAEEQLKTQPQDAKLLHNREKLIKEINNRELALYRQKVELEPTEKKYRFELGVRLLRAGQVDEAIPEFQAARAEPRLHWQALLHLGRCFTIKQNWSLARRNFDEALLQIPANEVAARKELLFELAQGHARAGELSRAVELALDLANMDYGFRNIGQLLDEWQARMQTNAS